MEFEKLGTLLKGIFIYERLAPLLIKRELGSHWRKPVVPDERLKPVVPDERL